MKCSVGGYDINALQFQWDVTSAWEPPQILHNVCVKEKIAAQKHYTSLGNFFLTSLLDISLKRTIWNCGACLAALQLSNLTSPLGCFLNNEAKRRAAWNRDSWKININFRSQILSVCCRLSFHSSEKAAVLSYFLRVWICVHVCGRQLKGSGWMI